MGSIAVVGGGIVGLSLAYHLRQTSRDVTVYERRALGAGTTGKSIACFGRHLAADEVERALVSRSWDVYGPLVAAGKLSYHETGLMIAAETEAFFEELRASAGAAREAGVPAEVLAPAEVSAHNVSPEAASEGATLYPSAGRLDPTEILSYFADEARDCGVDVETGVEVTDVRTESGAVTGLETSAGVQTPDVVVNAAGPWAPEVDAMAGVSLPLTHTLAPIVVLESGENVELPTVAFENGVYFTAERSATVLAGHAAHSSSDEVWDTAAVFDAPEGKQGTGPGSVSQRHRERVAEYAPVAVPKLEGARASNEWRGIRCFTPDERPIVGPTGVDGFYVASGMSGWGITLGPACGQLLADHLVTGDHPDLLETLGADRFEAAAPSSSVEG
jgi:sarcosine oxidase subunit beta